MTVIGAAAVLGVFVLRFPARYPTTEQRTRATALAQEDRAVLDELVTGLLGSMDASVTKVIYDNSPGSCFADQMMPTGSRTAYSKSVTLREGTRAQASRLARQYLDSTNSQHFGGRGQLSSEAEIDGPPRHVTLYAENFNISVTDTTAGGFQVEVSGPCRTG